MSLLRFRNENTLTYASVMKTPQPSFTRIVRESGTTLVVTMGLYLVPEQSPVASLLGNNSYRQVMGPRRKPCGTILAHGTTIMELLRAVPIYSHPVATNALALCSYTLVYDRAVHTKVAAVWATYHCAVSAGVSGLHVHPTHVS